MLNYFKGSTISLLSVEVMTYFYLVLFKYVWNHGKMGFIILYHVKDANMSSPWTVSPFIDILKSSDPFFPKE